MNEILSAHFETEIVHDSLDRKQLDDITTWINRTGDLQFIGGTQYKELSPEQLKEWFDTALTKVCVKFNEEIVGFATLSKCEAKIPGDAVEICHCIVDTQYRRQYNGSLMILSLTSYAKNAGFTRVVGRIVRNNLKGHSLLKSLRWDQLHGINYSGDSNVTWYQKSLK